MYTLDAIYYTADFNNFSDLLTFLMLFEIKNRSMKLNNFMLYAYIKIYYKILKINKI